MTAERWTQIRQLFDAAMEQPAGNRELYVRELSNQDQFYVIHRGVIMLHDDTTVDYVKLILRFE